MPQRDRRREFLSNGAIFSSQELMTQFVERVRKAGGEVSSCQEIELDEDKHKDWVMVWDQVALGAEFPPISRVKDVF